MSYTYDDLDNLVTTIRPDGSTTTQAYDAENHRTSATDAEGLTTSYAYDGVGRQTTTMFADGSTTATKYDAAGQAVGQTDELGHTTLATYDAAGRNTTKTDALGNVSSSRYDATGNQVGTADALGHVTAFAFDASNRLVATTYADGTADATTYDGDGRAVAKTDALGRVTRFGYDALGRLVSVTDALGDVTSYGYDEVGNRVSQADANGHTTRFVFDARNRLTGRTLSDGSSESKAYDGAGELQTRVDFIGRATSYAYDPLGRLLSRKYPDASIVSFTYTANGQRTAAIDARGATRYAYDARNRVTSLTYPDGRALTYRYDAHGDRTSLTATIGATALTTSTAYDADERPSQVTDPLGRAYTIAYDADGDRTSITYPNGTTTTYAYDTRNRVTDIDTTGGGETVQSFAYTVDAVGRRTGVAEADGTTRAYGYDGIDRLTSETVIGPPLSYAKTFAYDPVGNRKKQVTTGTGAGSVTYAYDTRDRLTTENATSYAYDADGNVTSKSGEASYAWDFENRLISVPLSARDDRQARVRPGWESGTDGRDAPRRRKRNDDKHARGYRRVPELRRGRRAEVRTLPRQMATGTSRRSYVRNRDELLAVMRPGSTAGTWSTRFVHHDGLASVRALTDETGTVVDTRGYEAFGTKNVEAGNDALAYGFAGEPFQQDSMLAYHRARWMDARVGRFLGQDPKDGDVQRPITLHRYAYVGDAPTSKVDPRGTDGIDAEPSFQAIVNDAIALAGLTLKDQADIKMYSRHVEGQDWLDHLYMLWEDGHGAQFIFEGGPEHGHSPRSHGVRSATFLGLRQTRRRIRGQHQAGVLRPQAQREPLRRPHGRTASALQARLLDRCAGRDR